MNIDDGGGREGLCHAIFIFRVDRHPEGRVTGVIERVRTGEKVRVETLADVERVLAAMLADVRRPDDMA